MPRFKKIATGRAKNVSSEVVNRFAPIDEFEESSLNTDSERTSSE